MPIQVALYRREMPVLLHNAEGGCRLAVLRELDAAAHNAHVAECYNVQRIAKAFAEAEKTEKTEEEINADAGIQAAVMPTDPAKTPLDKLSRSLFLEVNPTAPDVLAAVVEECRALPDKEADAKLLAFYHASIAGYGVGQGERPIAPNELRGLPHGAVDAMVKVLREWDAVVGIAAKNR